jgi:hypothetical protein
MIAQESFVIVAEVPEERIEPLRALLAGMTLPGAAGAADPNNSLLPFARYDTIHFARFAILADNSLGDRADYPELPQTEPTYLLFMVDCDGDADDLLRSLARECPRLREIFEHCVDRPGLNLSAWLRTHWTRPAASYVNWVGRTVVQVREEAALRAALRDALRKTTEREPQKLFAELKLLARAATKLTPEPPTPFETQFKTLLDLIAPILIALVCMLVFPLPTLIAILIGLPVFAVALRRRELSDPVLENPYDLDWVNRLRLGEDHDVTNQYTAMGSIKPGLFRLAVARVALWAIDWAARHIFNRGALARIGTIHFAHWVFLDSRRRMVFCSNYDGAHEAYMDDFINKVGFGLNLSFSGAIAYPPTDWLISKGAWREQDFKLFQRRHQIPTDVWYKAYPGLTARDLSRNSFVRNGFERAAMSDDEIRRWLAEL